MKSTNVIYKEVQKPRQPLLLLIVFSIAAIMWIGFIRQVVLGIPVGDKPAPDGVLIVFWIVFGMALPVILPISIKLIIEVHEDGLYIRYTPFHLHYKKFLFKDIKQYKPLNYRTWKRFGGWGFRVNFNGETGYILSGKQGIELTLKYETIVISTDRPEELKKAMDVFKE
ncbi:DUF6141 family protein [Terribacillus halophilus]|uniref:DUF6141 family protein n=1 Tax=Terribacillus halophilus TaxID=361279 RepID=UPI000B81963A|nr:DUF6141 family protein [Terribacillus halophilus]